MAARVAFLAVLALAPRLAAIDLDVTMADVERALRIARGTDRERERFAKPYVHDINGPLLKRVEVITEFRRMVVLAEERRRAGDWMFINGRKVPADALKPWKGLVTIVATLEYPTPPAFVQPLPVDVAILDRADGRALPVRRARLSPVYWPWGGDPGGQSVLAGAVAEADFDAAEVGQHTRVVTASMQGTGLARLAIDFAAIE